MKVHHFSSSSDKGGAARAASRIHLALLDRGIESSMFVDSGATSGNRIFSRADMVQKLAVKGKARAANVLLKFLSTKNAEQHSLSLFPSRWLRAINGSSADVVHLHWVNREMLSISDIGRIEKPVVWTLHDMWPFSGAEHLCQDRRWELGYEKDNRPDHERGLDLNRWVFQRKLKHWKKPITIVTPSNWLSDCARASFLMKSWPIMTIPNCLDTQFWTPLEQNSERKLLRLPLDKKLILFGSYGSNASPNKGFDLLLDALGELQNQKHDYEMVVFGDFPGHQIPNMDMPFHFLGHISDDKKLCSLYNAVDAVIIPSRIESFGQVASEAQACGTPVVAFATTGLKDIVAHLETGYLASPFSTTDLANGIDWVIRVADSANLRQQARLRASSLFSAQHVAQQYLTLYERTVTDSAIKNLSYRNGN